MNICVIHSFWSDLRDHSESLSDPCGPGGGGGAPPLWKVIGTCRWTGYDFAGHQYWHRVSNRPNVGHHHWHRVSNRSNVVITIDTGYQNQPSWQWQTTSFITGSHAHSVLWQARDPGGGDDFFIFFLGLSAQHPQLDRVYRRSTILQQGMHFNVFSKVYCDRGVFFVRRAQYDRVRFWPPPPSGTPLSSWEVECPPPPPPPGPVVTPKWVNNTMFTPNSL